MHLALLATATLAAALDSHANWMPNSEPINPGFEPHVFNVVKNGVTIGTFQLDSSDTAYVGSGSGTLLYVTSDEILYASIAGTPHAYINFANTGTSCGDTGNIVFTISDTNKCAQDHPFALTSEGHLAFHSGTGTFLICGTDKHLAFNKNADTPQGCSAVQIIVKE